MADQPTFILGNGDLFTPADAHASEQLRSIGAHEAGTNDIRVDHLKQQYSSWKYAPAAAALGAVKGALPGATSAVMGAAQAMSPGTAQDMGDFIEGVGAAHPMLDTIGMIAGAGGTVAAAALTGGASVAAEGALATAAKGFVVGAATTADQMAIDHVRTPEGGEKVLAQLGIGGLLGSILSVGGSKLAPALSKGIVAETGEKMVARGEAMQAANVVTEEMQTRMAQNGGVPTGLKDYLVENELATKSPKDIRTFLTDRAKVTKSQLQEVRASIGNTPMELSDQLSMAQQVRTQVNGTPLVDKVMKAFTSKKPWTFNQLHDLRMQIDGRVNWADRNSMFNQRLIGARETVDRYITDLAGVAAAQGPEQAEQASRWASANKEFNIINAMKDSYKARSDSGGGILAGVARMVNRTGPLVAAGAAATGNFVPAAKMAAGSALAGMAGAVNGNTGGRLLVGLGSNLESFDNHVIQTIASKLGAKGVTAPVAAVQALTLAHYPTLAASISLAKQNPTDVIPRIAEHMENSGIHGELADAASAPALRALGYLASIQKQNPTIGTTVAPVPWQPSTKDKLNLLDAAQAVGNPLWALQNPNPARMGAVKAAYPILASKVAQMVAEQAAQRPGLSMSARKWASMVTGIPAHPLAGLPIQAAMALSVQQTEQKRQQEQQQAQKAGQVFNVGSMD